MLAFRALNLLFAGACLHPRRMVDPAAFDETQALEDAPEEEVRPDDRIDDERHDEENRLKPEFLVAVRDALDVRDNQTVYELVEPLHPADIADLIELLGVEETREQFAAAITDLMTSDVIAELNDHVREVCLLYTSPSPRDRQKSRMPSSA